MTVRANPARSWQAAWRHLFRYANDPCELRRNPIARRFLGSPNGTMSLPNDSAVSTLRAALFAAMDEFEAVDFGKGRAAESRRHRAILVSHIFGKEPANSVALALHLSRSQFYRERRSICERLARRLMKDEPAAASDVSVSLRPDVLALGHAKTLVDGLEVERALELLDGVARESTDLPCQIEARCIMGNILTAQLDYERAANELRIARGLLTPHNDRFTGPAGICQARIDLSQALLSDAIGKVRETRKLINTVLRAIQSCEINDDPAREFKVDALLFASEQANLHADFGAFRKRLAEAQSVFTAITSPSRRQRARLLWLCAALCIVGNDGPTIDDSIRMTKAARNIAEEAGLIRTATDACISLGNYYAHGLGDRNAALNQALPATNAALLLGNKVLIGSTHVEVAALLVVARQFHRALELLGVAVHRGKLDLENQTVARLRAAEAYLGLRDYRRAGTYAADACKRANRLGHRRLEAAALRVSAVAHHRKNEKALAYERIAESLELVERFGNHLSLASTYFLSSTITGNQDHLRLAKAFNPHVASLYQ